jgi:hypothetical protein
MTEFTIETARIFEPLLGPFRATRERTWLDLSDRGSTACFAANSFLATCVAFLPVRRSVARA